VFAIYDIQLQTIGSLRHPSRIGQLSSVRRSRLDRAIENLYKPSRYRTGGVRFELLPIRWWTPAGWQSQQFLESLTNLPNNTKRRSTGTEGHRITSAGFLEQLHRTALLDVYKRQHQGLSTEM